MPDYRLLDHMSAEDRARTTEGLERLRAGLDAQMPIKSLDATMLLATWNIRELDSTKYGLRSDEAYLYLAEVIARFDVVAIQEVRDDLTGLKRLASALGRRWRWIVTDVTSGSSGNGERMAFLYDTRTVEFSGLASELVLPPLADRKPSEQIARTPFAAGFAAGWSVFQLVTVHIVYGTDQAEDEQRVAEIDAVANALADRSLDPNNWPRTLVLLGDFNIFARTDATMEALLRNGWSVPPELQTIPGSNVPKDKHYDQIAIRADPAERRHFATTGRAGVFDPFEHVYRLGDEQDHQHTMGEKYLDKDAGAARTRYFREWRTYQLSDHLPMWIEVVTDYAAQYLAGDAVEDLEPPESAKR